MAEIGKQEIIDQINALTVGDNQLTEEEQQYLINWILAGGKLTTNPRDLIQVRRGLKEDLPNFAQGEIAVTLDEESLYIGGVDGNIKLTENVEYANVKADGITDDTVSLQKSIDKVIQKYGSGVVVLPVGTIRTSKPINLYSNVTLRGQGRTQTFIKPLDNAIIPTDQGIVQTLDFLPDRNVWDYYEPYSVGLHMGVTVENLCIDGNRENQITGNGLCIYGGKWSINNVSVINTAEHGIWTECGKPNNSVMGDDLHDYLNMHESSAKTVFLANNNKHGWYYRGPNDSYLDDIQIKMAGWAGFYQDKGSTFEGGGLEIGTMHSYFCECLHEPDGYMIHLVSAQVNQLYVDSSKRGGLKLTGGDSTIINQIYSFKNNIHNENEFWSVKVDSPNCIIVSIKDIPGTQRNTGSSGGAVWVTENGSRCSIGVLRSVAPPTGATIPIVALKVEGRGLVIDQAFITQYGMTSLGTKAIELKTSECLINGIIISSPLGLDYQNGTNVRNNSINIRFHDCTVDYQILTTLSDFDFMELSSNKENSLVNYGTSIHRKNVVKKRIVQFQSEITPNNSDSFVSIEGISSNLLIKNVVNPTEGSVLTLYFAQDSVGGHTISFDSSYRHSFSNENNGSFKRSTITFIYNGVVWIQTSSSGGWL